MEPLATSGTQSLKRTPSSRLSWIHPVEIESRPAYYRYAVAVAAVLAAAAIRMVFLSVMGMKAPFVTFYPAVMFAALYGSLRAGLLATVLSAIFVDFFWIEPANHLTIGQPADWLPLMIFLLSGALISWITGAMHRARASVAAAETQALLASEREAASEALRIKEEDLREAQRQAHIGSWYWDAQTDITTGSEELLRLYGFDPAAQGMPDFKDQRGKCYPVEDWERIDAAVRRTMETGEGYELDVRVLRDRATRWATTRGDAVRDAQARIVGLRGTVQDITERKQAELELEQIRNMLSEGQRIAHLGSWEYIAATRETVWSDEQKRIYGLDPSEPSPAYDEMLRNHIHPDDVAELNRAFGEAMGSGSVFENENRIVRSDGSVRLIFNRAQPYFDDSGNLIRYLGTTLDITERTRAEEDVRRNQKIFYELIERSPFGTYVVDSQFRIAIMNTASQAGAFRNVQPLIGRDFNEVIRILWPEEVAVEIISHFRYTLDTGKPFYSRDFISPRHDAEIVEAYEWELHRMTLPDGHDGVICYYYDSTKLREAEAAVRKSEERFRGLVEQAPEGIFVADAQGRYLDVNSAGAQMLGLTREEVCRMNFADVLAPEEMARIPEAVARLAGGTVDRNEWRFKRKDGSIFIGEVVGRLLPDGRLQGILRDVTVQKQAETMLKSLNEELELRVAERTHELATNMDMLRAETSERILAMEALREKEQMLVLQSRQAAMGEMIGNIAHQWRQPLNTLGLYTQRLGAFYGMPNFNKEFLDDSIAKSMEIIQHMSQTIDDFRNYFSPEKEKADFYVIETIKSTVSLLEGNFHNPMIKIDFVEHDNPVINGYHNEFAQVFLNILNNARDAVIEREIADARVVITICSENNCVVVTVADNAGGIPDEVIKKVFDPYFTTKGPQTGTGIGLFMSKTIIEKNMGGRLTVRNTDIGAEFRIEVNHGTQN